MFITDPQDHLYLLRSAGLIQSYQWLSGTFYLRLRDGTPIDMPEDQVASFARGLVLGALHAGGLNEDEKRELREYDYTT